MKCYEVKLIFTCYDEMYGFSLSIMTMRKKYRGETSVHFMMKDKEIIDEIGLMPIQCLFKD